MLRTHTFDSGPKRSRTKVTKEMVHLAIHRSGAERDTQVSAHGKYIPKSHPVRTEGESTLAAEWAAWLANADLALPDCYAYMRVRIEGVDVEAILMQRIAYTAEEFLKAVSCREPTTENALLAESVVVCRKVSPRLPIRQTFHSRPHTHRECTGKSANSFPVVAVRSHVCSG